MGLDITAYAQLKRAEIPEGVDPWDYADDNNLIHVYNDAEFAAWSRPLTEGYYSVGAVQDGFGAGSYSGYNLWRTSLAKMVHGVRPEKIWDEPEVWKGKPFFEIINFSDCEGTIGTEFCIKLANDFREFAALHPEATLRSSSSDGFDAKYMLFYSAFDFASNGGCVRFH